MDVFEMIAMIVIVGGITSVITNYFKYRQGQPVESDDDFMMNLFGKAENEQKAMDQRYKKKISELEERIKVLERIVTDDKYDLKKEFEKLDVA